MGIWWIWQGGLGDFNTHCYPSRTHTSPFITLPYHCDDQESRSKKRGKRERRGEAGWEEDEGSQKSDKRAQTIPSLIPLVFNIRREYITHCVVLATAEMVFELAASIRTHLCSFVSREELTWKRQRRKRMATEEECLIWRHCFNIDYSVFSIGVQRSCTEHTLILYVASVSDWGWSRKRIVWMLWNKTKRTHFDIHVSVGLVVI